jgi:MYXO-CTERM domain-containing protein
MLVLATAGMSFGDTNLLSDPGFEGVDASAGDVPMSNGGPWQGWNNWVSPYSGYYTAATAHTGTQAGKTFSGPNAGIYQYVTVTAGATYTASAYFEDFSGDPLQGGETDDVRMIFWSGPNGTGSALVTDVSSSVVDDTATPDTWIPLSVTAVAPAGTESVQWMAFFNNPNYAGGSLFVDDASLVAVPEPSALPAGIALLAIGGLTRLRRRPC